MPGATRAVEGLCPTYRSNLSAHYTKVLAEMAVRGIMGVSLENALQRSSIQGRDQADVDGLIEEIVA